ncbi:MAG: competence protein ComK [Bacilli bacterium]|nr:competence protein ComK [Bacilli bacterium]
MDNYFISENTLMIMPYAKNKSKVIENYVSYIVNKRPFDLVNDSCKYYGSSYLGRCESTDYMIGVKYKCPIVVSEVKEIIIFPTTSVKNDDCVWLNYNAIEKYYNNGQNKVVILLKNSRKFEFEISERIISNQIFRSSRLESVLKSKKR